MGWTSALLTGLAELLDASGAGIWRQDPADPYGPDDVAIVLGAMPATPVRCILLSAYPVSDHMSEADVTVGVQVRTRAGPDVRDVLDLDDAVWELLHGATDLQLGVVDVVQVSRRSSTSLGQARDATGVRWERVSNYYADAMRPTAHRPY
jgi:hypothetical protein